MRGGVHYPDGDRRCATAPYAYTTHIACLWKRGGKKNTSKTRVHCSDEMHARWPVAPGAPAEVAVVVGTIKNTFDRQNRSWLGGTTRGMEVRFSGIISPILRLNLTRRCWFFCCIVYSRAFFFFFVMLHRDANANAKKKNPEIVHCVRTIVMFRVHGARHYYTTILNYACSCTAAATNKREIV